MLSRLRSRKREPGPFTIATLKLEPGDVLVIKSPKMLDAATCARIEEQVEAVAPGHRALVLDRGFDMAAIRPAPSEQRGPRPTAISLAAGSLRNVDPGRLSGRAHGRMGMQRPLQPGQGPRY